MSESPQVGRFVWFDLMSTDVEGSKKFYTELLGWTTTNFPMEGMDDYCMLSSGGTGIGGIVPLDKSYGAPSHWMAYITVADVDASVKKAESLGGKGSVPPTDIPNVGRFAVVADPQGATFSPFKSLKPDAPEDDRVDVGQFCWSELVTTDVTAAAKFYHELLGWTHFTKSMGEMGDYTVLRRGDRDTAGMMKVPPGAAGPPSWVHYIHVADTDKVTARIAELGGKVWVQPSDIPEIGRFSVACDPQGATFALHTPLPARVVSA